MCQFEPVHNGFIQFAPQLAESNDGFEEVSFAQLARLEPTSFWFRSRNRLVVQLLQRHFPHASKLLEVGCGTGYVLAGISAALPQLKLTGAELYTTGLRFALDRLPGATLYQMDCRHMPFDSEFDVVCALDVLEHIEEDEVALEEIFRAVRPGGGAIVSVPQHPFLWNAGDDFAHHKRRYQRKQLASKLRTVGFRIDGMTSFVTSLLPAMAMSRYVQRARKTYDPVDEYRLPTAMDRGFERLLEAERWLIARGLSLPAGGSLYAVVQRPA